MSAIAGVCLTDRNGCAFAMGTQLMNRLRRFPANDTQAIHGQQVFLGCLNHWITPESVGETNPYYNSERSLVITADAIIDNRRQLFELLQVERSLQTTMSDGELILLAYSKWGEQSPAYLIGDFAFMIWDEARQRLFGARDFSGSRTLYYCHDIQAFSFCTAIEPLLAMSGAQRKLNEYWLAEFLAITGMVDVVDTTATPYQGIHQLPPAHAIVVEAGRLRLTQYTQVYVGERLQLGSNEEYVQAFQEVFQQAVSDRLRTHRQVGAQLSGGLDSGSIVSFAAPILKARNKELLTFSYVPAPDFQDFTPQRYMPNERPLIETTVQHVGGIQANYLDFPNRDSYSEIDAMLEALELPYKFFENSYWLRGMFEHAEASGVGVLLNGGRGNLSISWGAAVPYYVELLKRLQWIKLLREARLYSCNIGSGRASVLRHVGQQAFPFIQRLGRKASPYEFPTMINVEFAKRTQVYAKLSEHGINRSGWLGGANRHELRRNHFEALYHWNASNTLAAKLSLQHGLWKRDPSNDLRVIRFCLSLPEEQYVQNGYDRALIRRATRQLLPDEIRLNQRTQGVQGADWLHRMLPHWGRFMEELQQMSKDEAFLQYVDGAALRAALQASQGELSSKRAIDPNCKFLMRSLIVYRFIKKLT